MYQNINKIYHAAIYANYLKKMAIFPVQQNWKVTAFSNQKALILDFLKDKKDIEVVSVRVDDGYSGSNFRAPSIPGNAGRYPAWNCRLRSGKRLITIWKGIY